MKLLILGAGGIGGYFGAHLLRAGADVTFLVRPPRKALMDAHGLRIETPQGNFSVQAPTVTADTVRPEYDLIILAPKAYDLDDAITSLSGAIGQATLLPFLNGFDHLAQLDQLFGRERVMGGVAHIAAMLTETGAVRRLTDMHSLTIGHRHPAQVPLSTAFYQCCQGAGFDSYTVPDITQTLWDKWVFLATLAGMTTLCRGSIGDIVATAHGEALIRQMYGEACTVAERTGHPIGAAATDKALSLLTAPGSPFTASMLRDLQSGQRTEHEHILGALARRGVALGLPMDLIRLAHTHLAVQAARR